MIRSPTMFRRPLCRRARSAWHCQQVWQLWIPETPKSIMNSRLLIRSPRRSAAETIPGWRCRTTKAPAEAGASFGLMKRALARGELSDQRDAAKLNLVFVAKVRGIDANTLESARRSHGKFSSLAFLH